MARCLFRLYAFSAKYDKHNLYKATNRLPNLILLMGALMLTFGVNWFVNGVWGMKKVIVPAAVEKSGS